MGCSAYRDRGTCNNSKTISVRQLEQRVLSGLSKALDNSDLFVLYEREFRAAFKQLSSANVGETEEWQREISDVERKIAVLLTVLETGEQIESVVARLKSLEDQKADLQRTKPAKASALPKIPKDIGNLFTRQIADLAAALNADDATRQEALPILRRVFREIRLHPREGHGNVDIEVETLPHMAWLASESVGADVMPMAGALEGLEPPTPGL